MPQKAQIIGTGSYLPERVLSNSDLEKMVNTSDEWISSRTGMKERRIAAENEFTSDMGILAARQALEKAGKKGDEIDLVLVATISPDYTFPSTAALIQRALGAHNAAAFDLQAACTGYIYGLSIAKGYIESGMYKNILVVAAEKLSSFVNYNDRNTCVLFGDGAAASVVSASYDGSGYIIQEVCLGADGGVAEMLMIPAGGSRKPASHDTVASNQHFITMDGKEVFKHAVRRMESAGRECLAKANMTSEDINWLIPHQANVRIIDAISKRFGIDDSKVFKTVHKYGNTSASTIAIAFDELSKERDLRSGDNILLVAFGAGFTWGATILTKK